MEDGEEGEKEVRERERVVKEVKKEARKVPGGGRGRKKRGRLWEWRRRKKRVPKG